MRISRCTAVEVIEGTFPGLLPTGTGCILAIYYQIILEVVK